MTSFDLAFDKTMGNEGKYVNDPNDAGGETYKGISRKYNPNWSGWVLIDKYKNVKEFPKNLETDNYLQLIVKSFYKDKYWDIFLGDLIRDPEITNELFDTSVNLGPIRAITFLQEGLNYLNKNQLLYPDLVADGSFGPKTMNTLNSYLKIDSPSFLLKIMNVLQGMHYLNYMKQSTIQEKYCRGWFNRVEITKR